jgi:archaemetzincin
LSSHIKVLPLGSIDEIILKKVAFGIEDIFGIPCQISSPISVPQYAYDQERSQYNSRVILESLKPLQGDALKVLAITEVDIFIPIMKYVFGLSIMKGPCGVVSICRLKTEDCSEEMFFSRVIKTAIHELAHTFGLVHCKVKRCVMYPSVTVHDTDIKSLALCPNCFESLRWCIQNKIRFHSPGD